MYHDHDGVFPSSGDNSVFLDVLSIVIGILLSFASTMMFFGLINSHSMYCFRFLLDLLNWSFFLFVQKWSLKSLWIILLFPWNSILVVCLPFNWNVLLIHHGLYKRLFFHDCIGFILRRNFWLLVCFLVLDLQFLPHYCLSHCFLQLVDPFLE